MKSIFHPLLAVFLISGRFAFAEESGEADSGTGATHIEVGPVAVSVAVTGNEGGKPSKTAFLGVATAPLAPQLRAQLNLPEGMGLSVEMVAKGSPAEKAGIKQYDVLKKFNDQMLCAQEQLAVLVKSAGKGTKVTLVVLRGGKEQNMDVTLEEHDSPEVGKAQFSINGAPGVTIEVHDLEKMLQEGVTGNLLPEILKFSMGGNTGKGSAGIQQNWEASRKKFEQRRKELDAKNNAEIKKAQDADKAGEKSNSAQAQVFSIYPEAQSQNIVTVSDSEGIIEINDSNGKRTVKIKDPSGQEIFSAPLNTETDHDAVPEKFRAKVKDAEGKIKKVGERVLKMKIEEK